MNDFGEKRNTQGLTVYDPSLIVEGWLYFKVGRILFVLWESLGDHSPHAKALIDECLTREPKGLELRNQYLLKIRSELQGWKTFDPRQGFTVTPMASLCKILLSRVLDDSVVSDDPKKNGKIRPEKLTLYTLVGVDPSKELEEAVVVDER